MTAGDDYPRAEERRLFYVALTRARRSVTLFTVVGQESPFIAELIDDPDVVVHESLQAAAAAPLRRARTAAKDSSPSGQDPSVTSSAAAASPLAHTHETRRGSHRGRSDLDQDRASTPLLGS